MLDVKDKASTTTTVQNQSTKSAKIVDAIRKNYKIGQEFTAVDVAQLAGVGSANVNNFLRKPTNRRAVGCRAGDAGGNFTFRLINPNHFRFQRHVHDGMMNINGGSIRGEGVIQTHSAVQQGIGRSNPQQPAREAKILLMNAVRQIDQLYRDQFDVAGATVDDLLRQAERINTEIRNRLTKK